MECIDCLLEKQDFRSLDNNIIDLYFCLKDQKGGPQKWF